MDEIVVAQNKYISSKRASRLTGYAQDYIGQLVRLGKVNATKVGKAWFVDEAGLMRHINGSSRLTGPVKELAEVEVRSKSTYTSGVTAGITYPATWKAITYMHDDSPLSPISDSRDTNTVLISDHLATRDSDESSKINIKISRQYAGPSKFIVARTIDGVRFDTPERVIRPQIAQNADSRYEILRSERVFTMQSASPLHSHVIFQGSYGVAGVISYIVSIGFIFFLIPLVV